MKKRTVYFLIALCIFLASLGCLISGGEFLVKKLIPGIPIPFGTFSTWAGIVALSLIFIFGNSGLKRSENKVYKLIRIGFKVCFILAVLWGFVSYFLAGNWYFNFSISDTFQGSTSAYEYFRNYTLIVVILPFIIAIIYALHSLQRRIVRRHHS